MDCARGEPSGGDYILRDCRNFDLQATLDCGQCFRWEQIDSQAWRGIAFGRSLTLERRGDDVVLHKVSEAEFLARWRDYFDLGRDYGALKELLRRDPVLRRAVEFAPGIRVLRQNGWEAMASFIFSQNNNIKRNKGMIVRLCQAFGEEIPGGHAFPGPKRLAGLDKAALEPVRCGFRAGYLLDAAQAVARGRVSLERAALLPLEEARAHLMQIKGVGPKVADCTLLYGLGRVECVPVDVWMARVMARWFPGGLPEFAAPVAGIAQQYLFHFARTEGLA